MVGWRDCVGELVREEGTVRGRQGMEIDGVARISWTGLDFLDALVMRDDMYHYTLLIRFEKFSFILTLSIYPSHSTDKFNEPPVENCSASPISSPQFTIHGLNHTVVNWTFTRPTSRLCCQ
jgi:hypothetical protein